MKFDNVYVLLHIHTTHFYSTRELEGAVNVDSDNKDPLLIDVNKKFITCMEQFQKSTKVCSFVSCGVVVHHVISYSII